VLNQDPPGTDWIKDRWQAASDMHGTAIKGVHWITMQFASPITVSYIELDPEAALSKDYRIKVSSSNQNEWISIFDTNQDTYESHEYGQSPEVTTKIPLHVIHNISIPIEAPRPLTRIRIWIRSFAHGWGFFTMATSLTSTDGTSHDTLLIFIFVSTDACDGGESRPANSRN
jgi:hypothetical protein